MSIRSVTVFVSYHSYARLNVARFSDAAMKCRRKAVMPQNISWSPVCWWQKNLGYLHMRILRTDSFLAHALRHISLNIFYHILFTSFRDNLCTERPLREQNLSCRCTAVVAERQGAVEIFFSGRKISSKNANLKLKTLVFDYLEAKLELWAAITSFVGNLQMSVGIVLPPVTTTSF